VINSSNEKDAFVFIHGYNVDFQEAALRTAQIAYDIGFEGAPILYSWPSKGTLRGYWSDEVSIKETVPHLIKFLSNIAKTTGLQNLHLIAHSMGNIGLTDALSGIGNINSSIINQIILTAPDIDAEVFENSIVPQILPVAKRVTLYASSKDKALKASRLIKPGRKPRAGEAGENIVVINGMDTIDASLVDTDYMSHSYYGNTESLINDIFTIFRNNLPPNKRNLRKKKKLLNLEYWAFPRT
jgi:esterase/lipase superfamily enzyme